MAYHDPLLFAFALSPWQLLIALLVVLLLFGSRLPEMMRSLGRSVTEFKKGVREGNDDDGPPPKIEKP